MRKMYIIFQSSLVYSDVTIRHLKDLSQRFSLSPTDVADDYAKLRVKITTEFKLINLFLDRISLHLQISGVLFSALSA